MAVRATGRGKANSTGKNNTGIDWGAVNEAVSECVMLAPEGSFTAGQYAEQLQISTETARKRLKKAVASGKIKKERFPKPTGSTCTYYWLA